MHGHPSLSRAERGAALAEDAAFMAHVHELRAKYLGFSRDPTDCWALCHGDMHAGSVMVDGPRVKVIGPEFVVYGHVMTT